VQALISLYRNRLAREKGAVKKDWGGRLAVALAYPNHYRVGMSNLGFQVVYHLLNRRDDVAAERVFLPEGREMSLYLQSGRPLLSLETQRPLEAFHIIAFSISFETDYLHVLKILEMGRIPLLAKERDETHPLVMAGGVTTFLNPEPLAPFMDLFLLGEAEGQLDAFVERIRDAGHRSRESLLMETALGLESVYVPALYRPRYLKDGTPGGMDPLDSRLPPKIKAPRFQSLDAMVSRSLVTGPDMEFGDRILVEVGRGCGRSCRFCAAGYVYRPPRSRSPEVLKKTVQEAISSCGRVGLMGAAVSDVPGILQITRLVVDAGAGFSISSLRADTLDDELVAHLDRAGQKSIALAPEAGTERLRRVINKHLTEEQIAKAVQTVARRGAFNLKLYFLLGLPTETMQDVEGIVKLVKKIRHHMVKASARRGTMGRIRLSVNCFVPKPFTPFQWFPLEEVSSLKSKQKWLKKAVETLGGVNVSLDVPKWAYVQALLSMGDRRVAPILLNAHRLDGNWKTALRASETNPDFFVYRPRELDEILPWDFIDHGIDKSHLMREYGLALRGTESEPCRVGECKRCGVCPDPGGVQGGVSR